MGAGRGDGVQERDAERIIGRIIEWRKRFIECPEVWQIYEAYVGNKMVGWIEERQRYCDRGRWKAMVDVADLDYQDGFPRYFMNFSCALLEMNDFIYWRLWRIRCSSGHDESPEAVFARCMIPLG